MVYMVVKQCMKGSIDKIPMRSLMVYVNKILLHIFLQDKNHYKRWYTNYVIPRTCRSRAKNNHRFLANVLKIKQRELPPHITIHSFSLPNFFLRDLNGNSAHLNMTNFICLFHYLLMIDYLALRFVSWVILA